MEALLGLAVVILLTVGLRHGLWLLCVLMLERERWRR